MRERTAFVKVSARKIRVLSRVLACLVPVAFGVSVMAAPDSAEACGGTFCDTGPNPMPVNQTGETILFEMGPNYVEAHIRIEYDPDTEASRFAWLVPVPMVPEFSVSSEQLFVNALNASVPIYARTNSFDTCPGDSGGDSSGSGGDDSGGSVFLIDPDGGSTGVECDIWAQDCPEGQKCMPWANDGGNSWNATRCSPIAPNANAPGDLCTVEGSAVSGFDDCEAGSMCFNVDEASGLGVCTSLCQGSPDAPMCPEAHQSCRVTNDGVLPLCEVPCDPDGDTCPEGQACLDTGAGNFSCTPVHYQGTVGAFDVAVIGGSSADEVMQWLGDNGFQQDPAARPILEQYITEGHLFAAFRLSNGAGTDTIHPVALRFPDWSEACIPLRLTRIAAEEDMRVRALFLGDARAVPRNWRHVIPNPLQLNWVGQAQNYDATVSLAVDEPPANGRAFITEYAGPSDIVATDGLWNPAWNPVAFEGVDATQVVDLLQNQQLVNCEFGPCVYNHPLIEGILRQFLPVPNGVAPDAFYRCLSCYAGDIDATAWDAAGFARALDDRIVEPGRRALEMLQAWPYLTRLFTTISPFEMTVDPLFHQNFDLIPQRDILRSVTQRFLCNGDSVAILPDGREVYLPNGIVWPDFGDQMPASETIEMVPPTGAPEVEQSNTARIDELLWEYNCQFGWPSVAACRDGGTGTSGGTDTGPGGDGDGDDPMGTTGGPSESGSAGADDEGLIGRACACTSGGGAGWSWALVPMLLAFRRRRR